MAPYLLGEYRKVLREPYRSRTGHLLAENQVSYPLLQRPMSALPATRTRNLPGFNRTLNQLSLKGMVDLIRVERTTSAMPRRRSTK